MRKNYKKKKKIILQDYLKIDVKTPITYPAPYCYSFLINKAHFYKFSVENKISNKCMIIKKGASTMTN